MAGGLTAHFPVFLHLRVTNLTGPSSVMRSAPAQHRRMGAAVKNDRKRLRKRLAQQSIPNAPSTQPQSSAASTEMPSTLQQPASTARAKTPCFSHQPNAQSVPCRGLRERLASSCSRALHVAAKGVWLCLVPGTSTRIQWCPDHQRALSACLPCCSSHAQRLLLSPTRCGGGLVALFSATNCHVWSLVP